MFHSVPLTPLKIGGSRLPPIYDQGHSRQVKYPIIHTKGEYILPPIYDSEERER